VERGDGYKNVNFVILFLQLYMVFGQEPANRKRIDINIGHGGKDSGAIGIKGISNRDENHYYNRTVCIVQWL
tara:strand:+ start:576 stop:791 length:216 start_codon:yes stop_codon:yes gene_type:complete